MIVPESACEGTQLCCFVLVECGNVRDMRTFEGLTGSTYMQSICLDSVPAELH